MSFRDELQEKVTALRRAAMEAEERYLLHQGVARDEDGTWTYEGTYEGHFEGESGPASDDHRVVHYNDLVRFLDDLEVRFEYFYDLDVHPLDDISGALGGTALGFDGVADRGTAFSRLRLAGTTMNDVRDIVHEDLWSGDAAAAFSTNFVEPFDDAITLQQAYVQELNLAAMTIRQQVSGMGKDIKKIADHTTTVLEGEDGSLSSVFNVVSIFATAIGFALAPEVFGGISLASGLTSTFLAEAEREQDEPRVEWEITNRVRGGSTTDPQVILNQTWDLITELHNKTVDRDGDITRALSTDLSSAEAFVHPGLLPHGPDGNTANTEWPDADEAFHQSTIPSGARAPGVPISEAPLVVELTNLYEAGLRTVPSVAFFCGSAMSSLDECSLPDWLATYLPRTAPMFHASRDRLRDQILSPVRDYLDETGPKLVTIASEYKLEDEEAAERLRQLSVIDYQHNPPPQRAGTPF